MENSVTEDVTELVFRARRRDAEAFAALIERFEGAALSVAYGVLRNSERAGDAVQEAFLRAWQELPGLKEGAKFGGWLVQIVRHAAIDQRRKIRPTLAEFPDLAGDGGSPAALAEAVERERRVKAALDMLDETTREAMMLRYYEGLPTRDIAELLGMNPAAVDMRLSRGRGVLKERLADVMGDDEAPRRRAIGER